jgi:hypothetical protein
MQQRRRRAQDKQNNRNTTNRKLAIAMDGVPRERGELRGGQTDMQRRARAQWSVRGNGNEERTHQSPWP